MGLLQEFKAFALKGNVMDMAVGVIIGGAFGKIVTSLVNDVIMPGVGILVGGTDFKDLKLMLKEGVKAVEGQDAIYATETVFDEAGEVLYNAGDLISPAVEAVEAVDPVYLTYGAFIQNIVDFLIIAVSVFVMIKIFNKLTSIRLKKKQEEEAAAAAEPAPAPEPEPTKEELLLTEIRDILKNK